MVRDRRFETQNKTNSESDIIAPYPLDRDRDCRGRRLKIVVKKKNVLFLGNGETERVLQLGSGGVAWRLSQ